MGKSPHHVHNIRDFIQQIKGIKLEEDECISSYAVKALFASVPTEAALKVIKKKLEEDKRAPSENNYVST